MSPSPVNLFIWTRIRCSECTVNGCMYIIRLSSRGSRAKIRFEPSGNGARLAVFPVVAEEPSAPCPHVTLAPRDLRDGIVVVGCCNVLEGFECVGACSKRNWIQRDFPVQYFALSVNEARDTSLDASETIVVVTAGIIALICIVSITERRRQSGCRSERVSGEVRIGSWPPFLHVLPGRTARIRRITLNELHEG